MPPTAIKSILCPNCRKLISTDEARCPYCGTSKPGSWMQNNPVVRLFNNPAQFIKIIIYVNVAMFALTILISFQSLRLSIGNPMHFLSPSLLSLRLLGATGTFAIDNLHRWWSLLSASYLHGGILHILFNMMAFRQISVLIIREYGIHRMFSIYTLGGIIGFWISYLRGTPDTIGSSAAICSLIGAALYYGKSRRCLRAGNLPSSRRLGADDLSVWFNDPGHRQLGTRRWHCRGHSSRTFVRLP